MRGVLGGLSTAYVLAAALFGGAMLVYGAGPERGGVLVTAGLESWVTELEMRASPPQSINFPIMPFHLPLRGSLLEDQPASPQPAAPRHDNGPGKSRFPSEHEYAADPAGPVAVALVADRLRANLAPDLYDNFDLFLYVSKASSGPWAQRMYAFTKSDVKKGQAKKETSELSLLDTWPVSTGSETIKMNAYGEPMMTDTPVGYYQLDPERFYRRYHSTQWGMQMPNSMFLNWITRGNRTGLAIHGVATPDEIAAIGHRASAGCVELAPGDSRDLFDLIKSDYKGLTPRFAFDKKTKTLNNQGKLAHDKKGGLKMTPGYRVLVLIENYGGSDTVSQLYVDPGMDSGDTNG